MDDYENLRAIQLFAGFDDDEIGAFVDACVRRSVPADHVVCGSIPPLDTIISMT